MKVAISVPDPIFDAAERLAEELRVSRSQLYAQALAAFLDRRSATAVTRKLNEVYSSKDASVDPALQRAQLASIGREAW
jgi:DNA-binding transcriptional MocR family regulator